MKTNFEQMDDKVLMDWLLCKILTPRHNRGGRMSNKLWRSWRPYVVV